MALRELTGRRMATSMVDTDSHPARVILRVSLWAEVSDIEPTGDDDPNSLSLSVKVRRGRTTVYGKVDRAAWEELQAQSRAEAWEASGKPTAPIDLARERMYRR